MSPEHTIAAEQHFREHEVNIDDLGDIIDVMFGQPVPVQFHVIAAVRDFYVPFNVNTYTDSLLMSQNKTAEGGYLTYVLNMDLVI